MFISPSSPPLLVGILLEGWVSSLVPDELYVNSLVNALGTLLQSTVLNGVLIYVVIIVLWDIDWMVVCVFIRVRNSLI